MTASDVAAPRVGARTESGGGARIDWHAGARELHLSNGLLSYLVRVLDDGSLALVHLGRPLARDRSYGHLPPAAFAGWSNRLGDFVPLECPTASTGDYRAPGVDVVHPDGSRTLALAYVGHEIRPGKATLEGLPATYVESDDEATSVDVVLADHPSGLEVVLTYTIYAGLPIVVRSARIRNGGDERLDLRAVMSATVDLPDDRWVLMRFMGSWARERHPTVERLTPGRHATSSVRGHSSHQANPFVILRRPSTTEEHGEAIGLNLVYSGNFLAEAEVDHNATTRLRIGINPETFAWALEPGATFQAPEAVLAWSASGLSAVSDAYHVLYRTRLARGRWRDAPRPILLNNWEGTYFAFDEDKLVEIAASAHELGVELFVLDDGWFGRRDDDTTSLGDWFVDRRKLPNGLEGVARRVEALGMRFGLWIEPEMVSERSRLFEAHPDWAIGVPDRRRTESRQQFVLDMGRPEIVDHLFGVLSDVLRSAPISYVKWDMNRSITEPFSRALPADRQGEFFHRYILGVYELYRRLTEAFPGILFESCAGGGGRFDPGLLAYAPQGWTSDDTDAVERLRIQWGTSFAYPLSAMGAHVSAVPNHQVGRVTPLATRAAVAFFGVFGYELDATRFDDAERAAVADQVRFYRRHRELFQFGRFRRLVSPFEGDGNLVAWMVVSEDARRAIVGTYVILNPPAPGPIRVRPVGLDDAATYRVTTWPDGTDEPEEAPSRGGDDLMAVGFELSGDRHRLAGRGDFWSRLFILEAE